MSHVSDEQVAAVPGWFQPYDVDLFRLLLEETHARLGPGDLAELGVYLGKSAMLIGGYVRPGETFTVVDLFGDEAAAEGNAEENADQYADLSRAAFERWYLTVHDTLPSVVEGPSESIVDHAEAGAHRFVHVDASHLYVHVRADVEAARKLLRPEGVVVFDDYRSEHTPGVAAAVWQSLDQGLSPFALSPVKMYATFGDPAPWRDVVLAWAATSRWQSELQEIAGRAVVRLWSGSGERTSAASSQAAPVSAPRRTARALRSLLRSRPMRRAS
jgi:predicted O-methyltransferase YrrM